MTRYQNGKIYEIRTDFSEQVYIGSTCLPLAKRFFNHKKEEREGGDTNRQLFLLAREHGWHRFRITLLEHYPCSSKDELRQREEHHRSLFASVFPELCLNMCRAYISTEVKREESKLWKQRWREKNRILFNARSRLYQQQPHAKAYRQRWEEQHKEQRAARRRELYLFHNSWGGSKQHHNNLLSIDTELFG